MWRNADWARRKGLFAELHADKEGMDESIHRLADSLMHSSPEAMAQFQGQPQQQQPNVIVILPQGQGPQGAPVPQSQSLYEPPARSSAEPLSITADDQATHYLIAFKDHTVYSAVAYWVDGDTLHYFTTGNTHNQVSLSLVDRPLTEKLNKDSGLEVKLPPAKPTLAALAIAGVAGVGAAVWINARRGRRTRPGL